MSSILVYSREELAALYLPSTIKLNIDENRFREVLHVGRDSGYAARVTVEPNYVDVKCVIMSIYACSERGNGSNAQESGKMVPLTSIGWHRGFFHFAKFPQRLYLCINMSIILSHTFLHCMASNHLQARRIF